MGNLVRSRSTEYSSRYCNSQKRPSEDIKTSVNLESRNIRHNRKSVLKSAGPAKRPPASDDTGGDIRGWGLTLQTRTQRAWGPEKKSHADVGLVVQTKEGRAAGRWSGDHADGFFRALALEEHSPKRHMAILRSTSGNGCKLDPNEHDSVFHAWIRLRG